MQIFRCFYTLGGLLVNLRTMRGFGQTAMPLLWLRCQGGTR